MPNYKIKKKRANFLKKHREKKFKSTRVNFTNILHGI